VRFQIVHGGGTAMKRRILLSFAIIAVAAISVQSKEQYSYMKGTLMQMESTPCGVAEKGSKTVAGEIFGTDGEHKTTQQVLCQEYVLQGERTIYRIRPKDDKHPALLPIGETAEFRISKDKMILRVPEANGKEKEYIVVSMTQRVDSAQAKADHKAAN
jgi:hypothetical protein